MLISVIIPIYNISPYLKCCLDSCLMQTYQDIEVICVDDGSTDDSGWIADEYALKDSRFRVIHKKNEGLPLARKTGIDAANGEYLFHLDGDDNIPLEAISNLAKIAKKSDADIILGDYIVHDTQGQKYKDSRIACSLSGSDYLCFILREGLFNIWGKLIKRTLYMDNAVQIPSDIVMAEDLVAMVQLAYYSKHVEVCKTATYNYYIRPSSMSITNKKTVGLLTDRAIYAVDFIIRFLTPRVDAAILDLLANYVKCFVYEYMRSPYPVSMRRNELIALCQFIKKYKPANHSFREIVCRISCWSLDLAKIVTRLRNIIRR